MSSRYSIQPGELLVSLALVALGIFTLVGTQDISADAGYAHVGPRVFPYLISAGLLLFGGVLSWQAVSGGWRKLPEEPAHAQPDWLAFAILSTAILLHMAAIAWAGFVLASTFLFTLIARAFGSRKLLRDIIIGLLVSAAAYVLFTHGLGLNLPAGLLDFIGGSES